MATTFTNVVAKNIGTTPTVIFTAAAKTTLIGCNAANTTGGTLPFSLLLRKGGVDIFIRKNKRITNGGNEEVIQGKIVLIPGDALVASAGLDNSFDVTLSMLQGVP